MSPTWDDPLILVVLAFPFEIENCPSSTIDPFDDTYNLYAFCYPRLLPPLTVPNA